MTYDEEEKRRVGEAKKTLDWLCLALLVVQHLRSPRSTNLGNARAVWRGQKNTSTRLLLSLYYYSSSAHMVSDACKVLLEVRAFKTFNSPPL